jgi:hypothetical protein
MVVDEVLDVSGDTVVGGLIMEVGKLGLWIQGIGLLIVLLIIFYFFSFYVNWMRKKELIKIRKKVEEIDKKVDMLGKK